MLLIVSCCSEEGSNGDREMAAAFHMAGGEATDVTMSDLIAGRAELSAFNGIVFVGGFSYADVRPFPFLSLSFCVCLFVSVFFLLFTLSPSLSVCVRVSRLGPHMLVLSMILSLSFSRFSRSVICLTILHSWVSNARPDWLCRC